VIWVKKDIEEGASIKDYFGLVPASSQAQNFYTDYDGEQVDNLRAVFFVLQHRTDLIGA
jgi:hypothetical protein